MHTSQGDVLLSLSTLKRTEAQSVLLNWTQSKVKQTDKQMSDARRLSGRVGGQATNSLPICVSRKSANRGVLRIKCNRRNNR